MLFLWSVRTVCVWITEEGFVLFNRNLNVLGNATGPSGGN